MFVCDAKICESESARRIFILVSHIFIARRTTKGPFSKLGNTAAACTEEIIKTSFPQSELSRKFCVVHIRANFCYLCLSSINNYGM